MVTSTEQVFNDMNINEENLKESYSESKKILPKEWYYDIIKKCIDNIDINTENVNVNKKESKIQIQFEDPDTTQKFEKAFHSNIMPSITKYIDEKGENPKHYQRSMILETSIDGVSFNIYF